MTRAKTLVHVNGHVIRRNVKTGGREPVLTVKRGKANRYAQEVVIRDEAGREVARVVYRPEVPLSCGARVWIETDLTVELVGEADIPT